MNHCVVVVVVVVDSVHVRECPEVVTFTVKHVRNSFFNAAAAADDDLYLSTLEKDNPGFQDCCVSSRPIFGGKGERDPDR